jgi:hypothetical protein
MSNIEDFFNIPKMTKEQAEAAVAFDQVSEILSDLRDENNLSSRKFSCDDIADILRNYVDTKHYSDLLADVLGILTEVFADAQHSVSRSISVELDKRIKSDVTNTERDILQRLKANELLYSWIKTTSI